MQLVFMTKIFSHAVTAEVVGRGYNRKPPPPLVESEVGTVIRDKQVLNGMIKENV